MQKKVPPADQGLLFGDRFLETFAGTRLLKEPRFAIAELIANAWDAGATRVEITWPEDGKDPVIVTDNGIGMTEPQFLLRWRTLTYDRRETQGQQVEFPSDAPPDVAQSKRQAFGRNGVGRFAVFCFGEAYEITTRCAGTEVSYRVKTIAGSPLDLQKLAEKKTGTHGTEIRVPPPTFLHNVDAEELRKEIGLRFLSHPAFRVAVNGKQVGFDDVPDEQVDRFPVTVIGLGEIEVVVFDTQSTDRTVKHHGIAWHVQGRLVGECSWRSFTDQSFIDGRRQAAKRYTFIVRADCLAGHEEKDWSGFKSDSPFDAANQVVSALIRQYLLDASKAQRDEAFQSAREAAAPELKTLSRREQEKWETFVREAQEKCPTISPKDLSMLGTVLAKLEQSSSKYALLGKLHSWAVHQFDSLDEILKDWTIDMAREVLDEFRFRMKLVAELRLRSFDQDAKEVQQLQPIFERGLWIFGPEFETIHFTSNEAMTTVVQKLFASDVDASQNRPDFVILPEGSAGLYSYPRFDQEHGEVGIDRLVIVELKKAGVTLGSKEKDQCWKYVKELFEKGLIDGRTKVSCFVLGSQIDPQEVEPRWEKDRRVMIAPMTYDIVLTKAKGRLLMLYDKVKGAPFLKAAGVDTSLDAEPLGPSKPMPTGQAQQDLFDPARK